jgi:hypothetical protein
MSRLFKFLSISLFCLCSVAHAQESLQQLGEWMSHYYEKPAPDQFTKWLNDASVAGAFEKPSARFPLMIFTTEILKMNPDKGAQWCKDLATISSTSKAYVGWSFYNSNIPAAEQCVQTQLGLSDSDVKKIMSATRYDPLAKEPQPRQTWICCGQFSARQEMKLPSIKSLMFWADHRRKKTQREALKCC